MRAMADGTGFPPILASLSTYPRLEYGASYQKQRNIWLAQPLLAQGGCDGRGLSLCLQFSIMQRRNFDARFALSTKRPTWPSWPWRHQLTCLPSDKPTGYQPSATLAKPATSWSWYGTRMRPPLSPKLSALVSVVAASPWPRIRGMVDRGDYT